LLKAGEVLERPDAFRQPPLAEGAPLVAVGLPHAGEWSDFHILHGGDYQTAGKMPAPLCEWHSDAAGAFGRLRGDSVRNGARVVHWHPLDLAPADDRLFVMQIVTSLQHGGAETIARDLAVELPRHGVASRLVALGRPHRRSMEAPEGVIDLSHLPRKDRAAHLVKTAVSLGADVLHVHLTDATETKALAASGIPVMATAHNARAGWPAGWSGLEHGDIGLMLACSMAAEKELRKSLPWLPARTVWNGIRPECFPETPPPPSADGFTLVCVANPRPQKRLERLPGILTALRAELVARGHQDTAVRLVIAGETASNLEDAVAARAAVDRETARHHVEDTITWTEGAVSVREALAGAHALVSCSSYEGLSLAHLEALSSGRPVVACDTGGTRELAWRNPAMVLLAENASDEEFAKALADVMLHPPPSAHRMVWRDFTTSRMAARVAGFATQLAGLDKQPGRALWFVTNNLSTGGAQSSLRRLAKELHRRGHAVRIALLQEYPEHPGPGRQDLSEKGIDVFVPPPSGLIEAAESVDLILTEMRADPPVLVVFWNAIMIHKILLAERLFNVPVHDVSPGEMWFSSLDGCLKEPPTGVPCRVAADYGRLLDGIVVKYAAETARAAALGTRVKVIPNGVELPPLAPRPPRSARGFVFGTAARISPQKRLDELIEAFRIVSPRLPDAVLKIAGGVETGSEEYAAELRALSAGLPVEWLGETRNIASFHAHCDGFVMVSDPAGCPNASLEAMASGLPVIATDVGGASEQVIDGVNGFLVAARNPDAIARAMLAMAADPDLRHTMASAAREHVARHFTLERMTRDYLELFLPGTM
jgi:glycosyltransferase involved in cell wall biosynthesis